MPNGQNTDDKLRDREPVAFSSAITDSIKTFVLAIVALAVGFEWVNWTEAQTALVIGVVAAFFVVITTISTAFTRGKVTPNVNPRATDGTPLIKKT
ncbi:hypothetical protein [Ilumatobacter sp.]|uniref:hypothetical protein n=1 Tax=Ilumatobacter sp. TaxID=1967498 RepID=UPI003C386AF9